MGSMERFRAKYKVSAETGCWEWFAGKDAAGYGAFYDVDAGRQKRAHRFAYERYVGDIPADRVIHHECRNKSCVNPDHLRPVTVRQNTMLDDTPARRNSMREKCVNGHELDRINPKTKQRYCTTCKRERKRKRDAAIRTGTCKRGHDMSVTGFTRKDGWRQCMQCKIEICADMRSRAKRSST